MKALDLFCGCGGLSLGFQKAGFEIVGAYDAWQLAIDTYNENMSHQATFFDLGDVQGFLKEIKKKKFDVIFGGPPCQDFSSAGHRKERDMANLTMSYAAIIAEAKPLYFVMENVARARNSNAYQQARKLFSSAGYGLTEMVLDASYCGVPQIRKRFFCIGTLNETDGFMEDILKKSMDTKRMTVRDYFGDELGLENYYRHPRNYNRRAVFSVDEPSMTIRGMNRPIPEGYKGHRCDTAPIDKRVRPLTTQERSRIQTFPENFKWLGSKTDTEQMIGNAVPVNLARFVAGCIADFDNLRAD